MAQAGVAILLITANFLTSDFIQNKVVSKLRERHQQENLIILPIIAKACAWKTVGWLKQMRVRPKNERPVWGDGGSHVNEDLATIAEEIAAIVGGATSGSPAHQNQQDVSCQTTIIITHRIASFKNLTMIIVATTLCKL